MRRRNTGFSVNFLVNAIRDKIKIAFANTRVHRVREIAPQLRLCEFSSAEGGSKASMSELMALKEQMGEGEGADSVDVSRDTVGLVRNGKAARL